MHSLRDRSLDGGRLSGVGPCHVGNLAAVGLLLLGILGATPSGAADSPRHRVAAVGGANAVVDDPIETVDDLRSTFVTLRADYEKVLAKAGWSGEPDDLFAAFANATVVETEFPIGGRLEWMAYRNRSGADVLEEVEWVGREPMPVFEVHVPSDGYDWVFFVPKACGNLALHSKTGLGEVRLRLTSGAIDLVDSEGNPVRLEAGDETVLRARAVPGAMPERAGKSRLQVEEGNVELTDSLGIVGLSVSEGEEAAVALDASGAVGLSIPEGNPEPLSIRIGDAVGSVEPGTSAAVAWTPPACSLELRAEAPGCAPGGSIEVDASASSVPHGRVVAVELEVLDPSGGRQQLKTRVPAPFVWNLDADVAGTYSATTTAISDVGARSAFCEAKIEVPSCLPPPPTCSLVTWEQEIAPFDVFRIDASRSFSVGGEVEKVELEIVGPDGREERSMQGRFREELVFQTKGVRTFKAVAFDIHGQPSETCEARVEVLPRFFLVGGLRAGFERREVADDRTVPFIGGDVGLGAAVGRDLELSATASLLGIEREGTDTLGTVDLALDRRFDWGWLGVGVGLWDVDGDDEETFSLRWGRNLSRWSRRPPRVMFEARFFPDDLEELDRVVVSGGIRFSGR